MTPHLVLIVVYSVGIVGLGLWSSRLVRSSRDFFVASRSLGPGLIFTSMIAANIGSGATVGAAGLAYRDGLSAWWWSGSAGLASFALAFLVGPRLWRFAKDHDFYTTGDFLEFRYGPAVRGIIVALVCFGSFWILAAQLMAGAAIITVLTGAPSWVGSVVGGAIMTAYFTAGGFIGSARVNTIQLVVMLAGFIAALPFAIDAVGGPSAFHAGALPSTFTDLGYSAGPGSGWTLLALTGPAFVISPGLIQKSYGAANASALRTGVALNGLVLMLFALMPVLLGMVARVLLPPDTPANLVLPTVLAQHLPVWVGALALAAVFSTEVDTCDTILFMISTSVSKDLYKRYWRPEATDGELLRVARGAAVVGGVIGVLLSIYLSTIVAAMSVFYALLGVSLFVPVVCGLYSMRAGSREALASIAAGVVTLVVVRFGFAGRYLWLDPTLAGLVAAAIAFHAVLFIRRRSS